MDVFYQVNKYARNIFLSRSHLITVTIRPWQLFLIAIIIRNTKTVLSKTIPLGYLGKRGHLELRKKIRSIGEQDREVKEVRTKKINKDTNLKSRPLILASRLLELYSKIGFNR